MSSTAAPVDPNTLAAIQLNPKYQKEIATILRVENSTISGVLDRMQKRGLIDRILDPKNRRSIRVRPTEAGIDLRPDPRQSRSQGQHTTIWL